MFISKCEKYYYRDVESKSVKKNFNSDLTVTLDQICVGKSQQSSEHLFVERNLTKRLFKINKNNNILDYHKKKLLLFFVTTTV